MRRLDGFKASLRKPLRIYMVAEPLEKGLGEDIEKGKAFSLRALVTFARCAPIGTSAA